MFRKSISYALAIVLVLSSFCYVFASTGHIESNENVKVFDINKFFIEDNVSSDMQSKILEEVAILDEYGAFSSDIVDIIITDEDISYVLDIGSPYTIAKVDKIFNGSVGVRFIEGEKEDYLLKDLDGKLFLDGKELESANSVGTYTEQSQSRAFTYVSTTICPYGSASQYNYYAGANNDPDLTVEKAIAQMTKAALKSILMDVIFDPTATVASVLSNALLSAAEALVEYAEEYNPTTQVLSYKSYTYYHNSTNSYTINNTLKAKKLIVEWYIGPNYWRISHSNVYYTYGIWG